MGFLAGMLLGLGVFSIVQAASAPRPLTLSSDKRRGIALGCLAFLLAFVLTRQVVISVPIGFFAGMAPQSWRKAVLRRREQARREVWPEVIDDVVSGVRAGLPIGEALAMLAVRGPLQLRAEFGTFARQLRVDGRLAPALLDLKERLADPLADRILESLLLAHHLGGHDLGKTLSQLASLVRAENRARAELLARQSWTVNGARLAALAPWILLALFLTRPGTLSAFSTTTGIAILGISLVLTIFAYRLMLRLGRLPQPARIFAGNRGHDV